MPKDPAAVAMAHKRAASLTPERRKEIAQKAIKTRWRNAREKAKQDASTSSNPQTQGS